MPLLNLACANCSAPLEVGADLERFTCAYCGIAQIVERSGGVVSTRKLEVAISAVQRGTDRTAAELAMPRLTRELDEVLARREKVVQRLQRQLEQAETDRRTIALIAVVCVSILWAVLLGPMLDTAWQIACFFGVLIGTLVLVYKKYKLPKFDLARETKNLDEQIDKIEAHIKANRRILDTLPV